LLPLRLTVELARECMVGMWVWWLSEPGGPGRPEQQKRGVALGVSFFCILLAITGAVLLPIGLAELAFAERYNPELDFDSIDGGCSIVNVTHSAHQSYDANKKNDLCVDRYSYIFYKTVTVHRWKYRSETEDVRRSDKCEQSDAYPSKHSPGDNVPCWEPANGTDLVVLNDLYACGNVVVCIKLRDPADEHADRMGVARVLWMLGAAFLAMGVPCSLGVCCYMSMKSRKGDDGDRFPKPPTTTTYGTDLGTERVQNSEPQLSSVQYQRSPIQQAGSYDQTCKQSCTQSCTSSAAIERQF